MGDASEARVVKWTEKTPPSEQEAEARLRTEGYESFKWHDVPGANYPRHRHVHDECIWVLSGVLIFDIDGRRHRLEAGDRLYLPSRLPHTAEVPDDAAVTYLVGQKVG